MTYTSLVEAWGTWLTMLGEWEWFVTLTMRENSPEQVRAGWTRPGMATAKKMWRRFSEDLSLFSDSIDWVRVIEIQKWRGIPHIHALVGKADQSIVEARDGAWKRFGFNKIVQYVPAKGAEHYICKYIVKELQDIEFSPSLYEKERMRRKNAIFR